MDNAFVDCPSIMLSNMMILLPISYSPHQYYPVRTTCNDTRYDHAVLLIARIRHKAYVPELELTCPA